MLHWSHEHCDDLPENLSQGFVITSAFSCFTILSFSDYFFSYFQIHLCIMELMSNLGDSAEIKAEDSKGKEFHVILWKEKNKSFKAG